ncbi:MAG: hypothetical protein CVV44_15600 [Spirochaetae bacterium HGW-Spirochaetae-1]|nr:MAG: hypothetical protein CVV44_15600 [Spirochaetae bacterium HGW-Spirochaetae-1]
MKRIMTAAILVILALSAGCSPQYYLKKNKDTLGKNDILILGPLFLSDIFSPENDEDIFNRNLYVGAITFSGGIVTNEKMGMTRQSEKRTFEKQQEFRDTVRKFYLNTLKEIVQDKKVRAQFIESPSQLGLEEKNIIDLSVEKDRRRYEEDGQDNINLPRSIFSIGPLSTSVTDAVKKISRADTIVIPVIEYYYGHDGGWFNDQEWGCGAGARMSFHLYAFNVETGNVIFTFRNVEKNIIKFHYQMSHLEMSKELYKLEIEMAKKLRKVFP